MGNNVILIGFMGCGKTTVGLELSRGLGRLFLDTDEWISRQRGQTISEIFAEQGEEAFRDMETACLQELLATCENRIISVGGGLPVREANRRLLEQLGMVIYLQATPECIFERLKEDKSRPLLQGDNPMEKIRAFMEARQDFYKEAAQITVQVDRKSVQTLSEEIAAAIEWQVKNIKAGF